MKKILYISFGYFPFWSGGMVSNQIGLMKELARLGRDVTYFTAGRYDLRRRLYLKRRNIEGLKTVEMVNSPNTYDPYCYRTDPLRHCSQGAIETALENAVSAVRPDIVHISDLRMHCASVIDLLRKRNVPVVKTIHNAWDFCPKGDLMFNDEEACEDFDAGRRCLICLARYRDAGIPVMHRIKGAIPYEHLYRIISKFGFVKERLAAGGPGDQALPVAYPPESYVYRREFFRMMLNRCNIIHTTSGNLARLVRKFGVDPAVIRVIPLSARTIQSIKPKELFTPGRPVVFGYRGNLHKRKGIHVLLKAFNRLDQSRCRLLIYGDGDTTQLKQYMRGSRNIEFRGRYRVEAIGQVLKEIDVGVVPSIWEEVFGIVGLEYINARIPVIASKIGGVSEWLKDRENGFLFEPGDDEALAAIMARLLDDPSEITALQRKMKPWKTMAEYAREIDGLYRTLGS